MKRKVVREEGRELEEEEPRVDFHIHSAFFAAALNLQRERERVKKGSLDVQKALCAIITGTSRFPSRGFMKCKLKKGTALRFTEECC